MRQVPENPNASMAYALLGDGRLSKHLQFYFQNQGLSFRLWSRKSQQTLKEFVGQSHEVFLLAVSDGAIEALAREIKALRPDALCVHFSGAVVTPLAQGWHPLMSFGPQTFAADAYKNIPFVGETGGREFREVFPALANPSFRIDAELKARYHALCVMAGNFSQLLWAKAAQDFRELLALPVEVLQPFLQASLDNFFRSAPQDRSKNGAKIMGELAITGPLVRRDYATIRRHLIALKDDPYLSVYRSFVTTYGGQHEDFRLSEIQA